MIGRAEVRHAKRAGNSLDAKPAGAFGLPHGENCASGVLQDGHPPDVEDIKRRANDFCAKLRRTSGSRVGILDRDVKIPVRRNVLLALLRTQRVRGADIARVDLERGVKVVWANGKIVDAPAEEFRVEFLRRSLVGRGQLNPAKIAGRVLFDVWYCRNITPSAVECNALRLFLGGEATQRRGNGVKLLRQQRRNADVRRGRGGGGRRGG